MKIKTICTIASITTLATLLAGCDCNAKKLDDTKSVTQSLTSCLTIQRGVQGTVQDTVLSPGLPTATSGGTAPTLYSGGASPGPHVSLISFDLSLIPPGKQITSAVFSIYVSAPTAGDVGVHRVTNQWNESTTYSAFAGSYQQVSEFGFTASGYQTRQFDFTGMVKSWYDNVFPNNGFALIQGESARTGYRSSETLTITQRPSLTVCYEDANTDAGTPVVDASDDQQSDVTVQDVTVSEDVMQDTALQDVQVPVDTSTNDAGAVTGVVVGAEGVSGWDALSDTEKNRVANTKVFFGHMSVGMCMLGQWCYNQSTGTQALGFRFRNVSGPSSYSSVNLGDMTLGNNHYPIRKLATFKLAMETGISGVVSVAGLKFCYVDFEPTTDLGPIKVDYVNTMNAVKALNPQLKVFHVTPPLTTVPNPNDGWRLPSNQKRVEFGQWMKQTFTSDNILDLQDVENTHADGSKCDVQGTPSLCPEWAIDEGHTNAAGSTRTGKAFLKMLHNAIN